MILTEVAVKRQKYAADWIPALKERQKRWLLQQAAQALPIQSLAKQCVIHETSKPHSSDNQKAYLHNRLLVEL